MDPAEDHQSSMKDEDFGYFIVEADGRPTGFAILSGLASENRSILIKRVAVSTPGHGHGREAMRLIVRMAFTEHNAHRVWL